MSNNNMQLDQENGTGNTNNQQNDNARGILIEKESKILNNIKQLYQAKRFATVDSSCCDLMLALQIQDILDDNQPSSIISRIVREYMHFHRSNFELEALIAKALQDRTRSSFSGISQVSSYASLCSNLDRAIEYKSELQQDDIRRIKLLTDDINRLDTREKKKREMKDIPKYLRGKGQQRPYFLLNLCHLSFFVELIELITIDQVFRDQEGERTMRPLRELYEALHPGQEFHPQDHTVGNFLNKAIRPELNSHEKTLQNKAVEAVSRMLQRLTSNDFQSQYQQVQSQCIGGGRSTDTVDYCAGKIRAHVERRHRITNTGMILFLRPLLKQNI
jgi:hypothetical protein